MDETRFVSAVFFCVGLGLLARFFYVHDLWSLFHFLFYVLLTPITIKENGGLKILISGLDNWAAEIINYRNRVLIIESINETNNTPKANFTDTEIDMSQVQLVLSSSATAAIIYHSFATFSAANVSNCCHCLLLPPSSSIRVTSATIFSLCCHHLTLLRANTSAANIYHGLVRLSLLSSSSSAAVIFYSCYFCYHRQSLLPLSNTASFEYLCCYHLPQLRAAIVFYFVGLFYHRLPLLLNS
ncbi:hypothetical protein CDAR_495091 [Caerostris darwini]|uniref:Uncharacterized protein n=1 Tax=Caerostris darwini TaxID=1538125 RepID=A0AAV4N4Y8_9ARAC|nr:hypothetical protein CDAR_495091 [Caerostris darwini]